MFDKDENDFSKQRRNLILVSAIILVKSYLDIDYSHLNLFDKEIFIGNPEGIKVILWVFWIYFLFRYFNKFFEMPKRFKIPFIERIHHYNSEYAIQYFKDNIKKTSNLDYKTNTHISGDGSIKVELLYKAKDTDLYSSPPNYIDIPSRTQISNFIKSIFFLTFKTHRVSEYYFPIIFSALPLLWPLFKIIIGYCV